MIREELVRKVWVVQDVTYNVPGDIEIEGDPTKNWILIIDGARVTPSEAVRRGLGGVTVVKKGSEQYREMGSP